MNHITEARQRVYERWIAEIEENERRERTRSLVAACVALVAVCVMMWVVR